MILAVLLWLCLAFVPGVAIMRIARVRWGFWAAAAGAPTLGIGALYLLGLTASRLGLDVMVAVFAATGAITVAWIILEVLALLKRAGTGSPFAAAAASVRTRVLNRTPSEYVSWALVALAIGFGLVAWTLTEAGLEFPPGWDSMHHGYFTRQILDFRTLDSSVILSTAPTLHDGGSSFYPLAFNLVAAMVAHITAVPVSQVILASTIAIGAVLAPVTVYAFARMLDRSNPLVAGTAALVSAFILTPYAIIESGRVNAVLGLAVALGTTVLLLSGGTRPLWRFAWVPLLGVIGLTGIHTSELPIAILAAGGVALVAAARRGALPAFGKWFLWGAGATVAAMLVIVALEPAVLDATSQRSGAINPVGERQGLARALLNLAALGHAGGASGPLPVLEGLVLVGLIVPLVAKRWRAFIPTTLIYLTFGALFVGLVTQSLGPLTFLTFPWYQDFSRLAWSHAILGAIPAAVALTAGLSLVARGVARIRARSSSPPPITNIEPIGIAIASVLILVLFALPGVRSINQTISTISAPATSDSRAVFEHLHATIDPHAVVLDDLRMSGSLWMYNDYSVRPLFGNSPYLGSAPPSWKERLWLRSHLDDVDEDECVPALLDKYDVEYIYVDSAKIWDAVPQYTRAMLDAHDVFKPYFASGDVAVYSVDLPAGMPTCDRDVTVGVTW